MIRDPLEEVLGASLRAPDDATVDTVAAGDLRDLRLARRRFGVSLPPPFVTAPRVPGDLPVRLAGPGDGAAIAAVQRRSWRHGHRGLVPDADIEGLDLTYLAGYWSGRAAVSPTPRHRVLVAGARGEVHGAVDVGPAQDDEGPRGADGLPTAGEIRNLFVDPGAEGGGLGSALLAAATDALAAQGCVELVLWVLEGNLRARRLYERRGWVADGGERPSSVAAGTLSEVRYRRSGA